MSDIGIDISGVQDVSVAAGDWLFVVVKTTENRSVVNPLADEQWAAIRAGVRRGLYHYARPGLSRAAAQAKAFCDDALRRGFTPGKDMWQLDCEGELNEAVPKSAWDGFIREFMDVTLTRLGPLGFLYLGRFFLPPDITKRLANTFHWWLPDYGPNDGTFHALPSSVDPVIHQFTSVNPHLDRNVIHATETWQQLTHATITTSTVQEEKQLILVPRLAVPTLPTPPGRVPHIRFDRATKTLLSFGYDFVRDTPGWSISEGFGLVVATLTLPTQGPNADLDFAETRDGRAIFIAARGDFGTFQLRHLRVP
jgi:GH25 family lysozyme M1 (1,4-beta-N-acetylmuramidase)